MATKNAKKQTVSKPIMPKKPQSYICLKKPDRVILHYGNRQLELASTETFDKQVVSVDTEAMDKYLDFIYTGN